MNPQLLYSALRARFRVVLIVLVATVLVTLMVSLLLPKTYVASVAMLVDSKDEQSMSNTVPGYVRERTGYMQTQADIISSQKVARKVVNDLRLADQPRMRAKFEDENDGVGQIEDWLAEYLIKKLKVDITQSSMILIEFSSPDPRFSAQVANAFAKAYMDTALELRVEPSRQTAVWFDEQMKGLRANLLEAQNKLMAYQKEKGISSLDERFDTENIALSELATQVVRAQTRRAGGGAEGEAAPGTQSIRADLRHSEAKLAEFSTQFGVNHPTYQRQLAEVQRLRAQLSAESGKNGNGERREVALRTAMAAQQAKVMEMKEYRNQLAVLTRDVEIAQRSYETAMQRAVDKRVESHASLTNISILHAATAPFKASRPRIGLNIGLSVVIGFLLGLCVVYFMEMLDHRVRSLDDLKNEFSIPVLVELNAWQAAPTHLLAHQRVVPILPYSG